MTRPDVQAAEVVVPTTDLALDLQFFTKTLGFRLDTIFPADDPAVATLSGYGLRLRLDRGADAPPPVLRLLCTPDALASSSASGLVSPGGTRVTFAEVTPRFETPPTAHAFLVRRLEGQAPWVIGRAGMHYRDLIPGRLGGSIIASHIRIPHAGPVPDIVHYHTVGFQLIFCHAGWVRLVYEDQGPPFVLGAGDCVIQPPEIRHRVLESSDNLQVVEVGVPAVHLTTIDHQMSLPTPEVKPDRRFGGQRFCRSEAAAGVWQPWRIPGFVARDTGIADATEGVASVHVVRPAATAERVITRHTGDIVFTFVRSGRVTLRADGHDAHTLGEGDAYVVPPGLGVLLDDVSTDAELLEVALPGMFHTEVERPLR